METINITPDSGVSINKASVTLTDVEIVNVIKEAYENVIRITYTEPVEPAQWATDTVTLFVGFDDPLDWDLMDENLSGGGQWGNVQVDFICCNGYADYQPITDTLNPIASEIFEGVVFQSAKDLEMGIELYNREDEYELDIKIKIHQEQYPSRPQARHLAWVHENIEIYAQGHSERSICEDMGYGDDIIAFREVYTCSDNINGVCYAFTMR